LANIGVATPEAAHPLLQARVVGIHMLDMKDTMFGHRALRQFNDSCDGFSLGDDAIDACTISV